MVPGRVIACLHQRHQGFRHANQRGFFPPVLWWVGDEESEHSGIGGRTHLVAAKALSPIHGPISGTQKAFALLGMYRVARQANGTRQMDAAADTEGMGCYHSSDCLSQVQGVLCT